MGCGHDGICFTCKLIAYLGYHNYHTWHNPECANSIGNKNTFRFFKEHGEGHLTEIASEDWSPEYLDRITDGFRRENWDEDGIAEKYSNEEVKAWLENNHPYDLETFNWNDVHIEHISWKEKKVTYIPGFHEGR